ncbi:MAG: hypothetical protein KIS90_02525 [Phenylobacterium sp.]|nr:hypothetical protein [Phenylobacterium sp.]
MALTDREVPPSALYGQSFPPIWHMARRGEVKGVLIEFDPDDRTAVVVRCWLRAGARLFAGHPDDQQFGRPLEDASTSPPRASAAN